MKGTGKVGGSRDPLVATTRSAAGRGPGFADRHSCSRWIITGTANIAWQSCSTRSAYAVAGSNRRRSTTVAWSPKHNCRAANPHV